MPRWRPIARVARAADSVNAAANAGRHTANTATHLLNELLDGFRFKLVRDPEADGSVMDFVLGKIDELPVQVQIEVMEDE